MTINLQVAVDMLARIEIGRLDNRWDQTEWGTAAVDRPRHDEDGHVLIDTLTGEPLGVGSCQTAHCAAGWAVQNAGLRLRWEPTGESTEDGREVFNTEWTSDGVWVPRAAAELLGLDWEAVLDEEGDGEYSDYPRLFNADNSVDDLYRILVEYDGEVTEEGLRTMVQARIPSMQAEAHQRAQIGRITGREAARLGLIPNA